MSIVLVGSTSGSITLQEPAVAGTTVLTLPAVTGTVLTTTGQLIGNGTTTNDSASAGQVGETIVSTASGISLTTAASNGTSISLTAGDWDVAIYASGAGASATCTAIRIGISETSATFGTQGLDWVYAFADPVNGPTGGSLPLRRISLASTTTIYGVLATSAGTNSSLNCTLIARRRR